MQPIFDHARRLEIELNAAKEQLRTEAVDDYSSIKELQRELAAAKLDCGHAEKRCDVAIASWDEERGRALREGARVVELKARAERAEAELATERAIVSRIWTQLGSPTYEQLKGRSIYDLIDDLKAELTAERARLDWVFHNCKVTADDYTTGNRDVYAIHDREDLDAAMKEDAQ